MSDIQELRRQEAALIAEVETLKQNRENPDQSNQTPALSLAQLREQENKLREEVNLLKGNSDIPENGQEGLLKRAAKVGARTVGSNLIGGAAELAMLAPNLAGMLHGRPWVSPIAAAEKLFPEDWAPKTTGERTFSTVAGLMTPTGIGKLAPMIPKAVNAVAPAVSNYFGKFARNLPTSVSTRLKKVGNAIADESPAALAKMLPAGLAGHIAIENDAGPVGAIAASLATGIPVNYVSSKIAGAPKAITNWQKNAILNDLDMQRNLINQESKQVFNERVISPKEFGNEVQQTVGNYLKKHPNLSKHIDPNNPLDTEDYLKIFEKATHDSGSQIGHAIDIDKKTLGSLVQDAVTDYSNKQRHNWRKEYNPIVKELQETASLPLDNVINKWAQPLLKKENILEKNNYLKSAEGQTLLRLLNVKPNTTFDQLQKDVISKLMQDTLYGKNSKGIIKQKNKPLRIIDLSPDKIIQTNPTLSSLLSEDTKMLFKENFDFYKKIMYDPSSSVQDKKDAGKFFGQFINNRTEINTFKNAATIREMAIENASLGKYHGLPKTQQGKHMGQSFLLKEELLHPELTKTNPELSKKLRKVDKENTFWQERKKTVESLIGKENMTPDESLHAVISDISKGAHNLKFVKGVAGEKAQSIAEGIIKHIGSTGEDFSFDTFVKSIGKLDRNEKIILMTGLNAQTKASIYKAIKHYEGLSQSSKEFLHPSLKELNPKAYEKHQIQQNVKNNPYLKKRKEQLLRLNQKDMTPEQTQKAVLSDFGEGSYHLKFIKGIAGEKASKIAKGTLHVLGREGEGANIVNLYKEYKKLPKEDARIFWLGLTQETKDKVKESFDFIDKLNQRNISKKREVNPVEWYIKTPTLSWGKRLKKQFLKVTTANKYSKPAGMKALKEHLLRPSNLPRPAWKTTKEHVLRLPNLTAKQEGRRASREE